MNKLILITLATGFIFFSACEDEENTTTPITISQNDMEYIKFVTGDTLYFASVWIKDSAYFFNTNDYYIVSDCDTVKTTSEITISYTLDFRSIGNSNFKVIYKKDASAFSVSVIDWTQNYTLFKIDDLYANYETFEINGHTYHDVIHMGNPNFEPEMECKIHQAFFAKGYGMVALSHACYHQMFFDSTAVAFNKDTPNQGF